jgi:4-hydroxybenzoate polyprenyltransferase
MNTLFVDLDGTLLLNDSVQEIFFRLLLKKPWLAIAGLFLLITQGKAAFKNYMANKISLADIKWPLNPLMIEQLTLEKARGRKIILLTASHETIANSIVQPLDLFDQIVGSTETRNFKGKNKLEWIKQHFPNQAFDYAGNSSDDYILWQHCDNAIIVNPTPKVLRRAKKINPKLQLIQNLPAQYSIWQRMLRLHQYSKNILIFIPLLLSGNLLQPQLFLTTLLAFIAFCSTASVSYIINDFIDLDHDRRHSHKKFRPLAAGEINFSSLIFALIGLILFTLVLCHWLPILFNFVLIIYFSTTLLYSFIFKKIAILDVFTLSALYLLRIAAGSAATGLLFSNWLLAFALFFFLSLGYLKRFIEIEKLDTCDKISGRNYCKKDADLVKISGISLGFLSVLIFSIYLTANVTTKIYKYPNGLWLITLILLYWLNHLWYAANHHKIPDDPIAFTLSDKVSLFLALGILMIILICQGIF